MDKALKQRLTGAVILIALAIIFLPMLLDGDKQQLTKSQIELPQQPVVSFPKRRMPIGQQKPRPGPSINQPTEITSQDELLPEAARKTPASLADGAVEEVTGEASGEPSLGDGMVIAPLNSAQQRQSENPTTANTKTDKTKQKEKAEPSAITTKQIEPVVVKEAPALPTLGGLWKLQVASFSGQSNAEKLMKRLRRIGYQANIESLARDKTVLYRVLVPGYPDRSTAQLAAFSISKQIEGVNPKVITPESRVDDPAMVTSEISPGTRWVVQMGIFGQLENADKLIHQLSQKGYTAYKEKSGNAYKVMVGPILSRAEAVQKRDAIQSKIKIKGLVKES